MSLGFNSREPKCSRCSTGSKNWRCSHCGSGKLRAVRVGSHRTAEEIGRAFPGVGILVSGAQASGGIIDYVPRSSKIIVATPGSEPSVDGGYAAGLVVDSRFLRGDGPGADVEFIRKISRIASRICPAAQGGHLIFAGGIEPEFVRALGMWKQDDIALEILEQRSELMLPPAYRWLAVKGKPADVRNYLAMLRANLMEKEKDSSKLSSSLVTLGITGLTNLGEGMDMLGPIDDSRGEEITVYVRPHKAGFLHPYIRSTYREYSGKQIGAPLRIEVDPLV